MPSDLDTIAAAVSAGPAAASAAVPPTPTPSTAVTTDPLAFMEKLSSSVYVYRPPEASQASQAPSSSKAPKLIIIAAWMGARPAHIAKYLAPYRDGLVFGEAEEDRPAILLVFCHENIVMSSAKAAAVAQTALPVIQDALGDSLESSSEPTGPLPLVHILSNGGCMMMGHIYNAIDPTRTGKQCLPPHVTIFDSSPGHFWYAGSVAALSAGLERKPLVQRLLALPVIHAMVATIFVRIWLQSSRSWADRMLGRLTSFFTKRPPPSAAVRPPSSSPLIDPWAPHNDQTHSGGNRREVCRAYLYSHGDKIIHSTDIEEHAAEARQRGFTVALMAEFPGSAHVAHARTDPARYWRTIKDVWQGTSK